MALNNKQATADEAIYHSTPTLELLDEAVTKSVKKVLHSSKVETMTLVNEGDGKTLQFTMGTPVKCPEYFYDPTVEIPEGKGRSVSRETFIETISDWESHIREEALAVVIDRIVKDGMGEVYKFVFDGDSFALIASTRMVVTVSEVERPDLPDDYNPNKIVH